MWAAQKADQSVDQKADPSAGCWVDTKADHLAALRVALLAGQLVRQKVDLWAAL